LGLSQNKECAVKAEKVPNVESPPEFGCPELNSGVPNFEGPPVFFKNVETSFLGTPFCKWLPFEKSGEITSR